MDQNSIQDLAVQYLKSPIALDALIKITFSIAVALIGYLIFSRVSNYWLRNVLHRVVDKGNFKKRREKQIRSWSLFVDRTGGIVILFILALTILSDLDYNITPILTGAGILGVALGLGSQNFMKDVIGGVFIFLEGNYNEGDNIKVAGVAGKVKKINLRKTVLYSEEEKITHVVPHSEVKTVSILPKDTLELPKKKNVVKE